MTKPILITGARLIDPLNKVEVVEDLLIVGDKITKRGKNLKASADTESIDASGLWLSPGFIDLHCHLRDLGQQDKEDIRTGTHAAAAGGYTTILCMANTEPPVDSAPVLALLQKRIADQAVIEILPTAAVTKGLKGEELTAIPELAKMGVAAFSDDGVTIQNMSVLRRALEYAKLADKLVISHAEDKNLTEGTVMHECWLSTKLGLAGSPHVAETIAVARELEVVKLTKARYHFTHLSCGDSLEKVKLAKTLGLPVTADVTPHHLCLSVDDMKEFDTAYKVHPPLRLEEDRHALIAGIKNGTVDAIATDHAPHTQLDKEKTFSQALPGLIGLETAFALTYECLVKKENISIRRFFELFTTGPAQVLGLPLPALTEGSLANLVLIDPKHKWIYDPTKGCSKSTNTPFAGRQMESKVMATFFRGKLVYQDVLFKQGIGVKV